ncbi:MAG: STAS domain-containing protein [Gemmatimonadota bacterium]|nr:STAS domain-containing protein [Gemmatimonadota bacterium]
MNVRWIHKIPVIELSGRFLGDPQTAAFRAETERLQELGAANVVVDMGGLESLNSYGLGTLLSVARTLREAGGDVKLANLNDRTYNVMVVVTRMDGVFRIYETAAGAAASY